MKRIFNKALSYIPTALPVGMTTYAAWSDSVVELIGPIADNDSLRFCVASEVLRLGPSATSIPKNYFVQRVRAGAAKQIAGAVFTEIKEKQRQEQLAAQAAQQAVEVTPATTVGQSEQAGLQQTQG